MLEIEAVYENGVLKPIRSLPLEEHQHVHLTIQVKASRIRQSAGLIRWNGSAEELGRIALNPDFGLEECP